MQKNKFIRNFGKMMKPAMKAMIFAAGLGTRLRPLTDTLPKALVPVCGEPLLGHAIRKLVGAGADELTVNVHHFPDAIIGWLEGQDFGAPVHISDERDRLLETGGGLRHARALLDGDTPFLVHNVDIISDLDLPGFMAAAPQDALSTLLVSERQTRRYLLFDPASMRLLGWTDIATGEVRSPWPGLDPANCRRLAFSGIHYLSPAVFPLMESWPERFPIMDFYLALCREHPIYGVAAPQDRTLVDVGKIETLAEAEAICARLL